MCLIFFVFFFKEEEGIRDKLVTGVQTCALPIFQYAAKHEYSGFFAEEIARRRALRYPPFTKIINLIFRGKDEPSVHDRSIAFRNLLMSDRNSDETEVLGPAPLPLYRLRGQFRWHLMLRGFEVESMAGWVRTALQGLKRKKDVFLAIDVEPISIL